MTNTRRDLELECGDMGRYAHVENLRSQSPRFLVNADEAKAIIDTLERTVRERWHEIARRTELESVFVAATHDKGAGPAAGAPVARSREPR